MPYTTGRGRLSQLASPITRITLIGEEEERPRVLEFAKFAKFADTSVVRLLAEFGVHLPVDQQGNSQAWHGGADHPNEEVPISDQVRHPTAPHPGDHHPQRHETGANGEMGGLMRTVRKEQHVKHEGREAEAVAELFGGDRATGDEEVARLGPG